MKSYPPVEIITWCCKKASDWFNHYWNRNRLYSFRSFQHIQIDHQTATVIFFSSCPELKIFRRMIDMIASLINCGLIFQLNIVHEANFIDRAILLFQCELQNCRRQFECNWTAQCCHLLDVFDCSIVEWIRCHKHTKNEIRGRKGQSPKLKLKYSLILLHNMYHLYTPCPAWLKVKAKGEAHCIEAPTFLFEFYSSFQNWRWIQIKSNELYSFTRKMNFDWMFAKQFPWNILLVE